MRTSSRLALVVALLAWSSELSAQYRRVRGDTVRVREQTASTLSVSTPNGAVDVRTEHDATIAVTFGLADSAQGWYESLRISSRLPQGLQEPNTAEALRRPFTLRFDDRGRIETLAAPTFPVALQGITDLSHQFDDLFLRLPAGPLRLGLAWTDSAVVETGRAGDNKHSRAARTMAHRVVRDTAIAGERAWVIESVQQHALRSTQPAEGQPLTVRTQLTGADSGVYVFSQANGRMLGRRRTGTLSGTLTYEGGPRPVSLPVQQRYEHSVTRVP